jgi:GrpB-like predicted nucleotidyltransferase (UPF0157 family)
MTTSEDAPMHIVPYDPQCPTFFEKERMALARLLAPWLVGPVEHFGSTAVPGCAAKPVIDIMAAVGDLEASRPAIVALAKLGYQYVPYRADLMHWLCKPSRAFRTHHLHLVPFQSELWCHRLTFRDFLRLNPSTAAEYAELKHGLAERHRFDRDAYTDAKGSFVRRVLELSLSSTRASATRKR